MEDTNEYLFKFKQHLAVLNRSPATIEAYTDHTRAFLKSAGDIKQITRRHIEDYIANLYDYKTIAGKPYKIGTICLKVRSVKRFFEFLEKANIIFINPAECITEPKKEKGRIKTTLTRKEANKILDQPNLGTLPGIRDRAILEVFYSTGIRLNEMCALTIYDADLTGGMLRINKGKGSKDRVVPLGKHAVRFLREYITKVRPKLTIKNRTCRHLFVNRYGGTISDQVAIVMVRRYVRKAKIKKQVTAHTFRHTFATVLIKNGADIAAVQKMMGHSNIKTTQGYLRSLGVDIKAVHQKTHPREKDKEVRKRPKIERIKGPYERN